MRWGEPCAPRAVTASGLWPSAGAPSGRSIRVRWSWRRGVPASPGCASSSPSAAAPPWPPSAALRRSRTAGRAASSVSARTGVRSPGTPCASRRRARREADCLPAPGSHSMMTAPARCTGTRSRRRRSWFPSWRSRAVAMRSGAPWRCSRARTTFASSCSLASSVASPRCARARCRWSIPTRPSAATSVARSRRSTSRRPSRAQSN